MENIAINRKNFLRSCIRSSLMGLLLGIAIPFVFSDNVSKEIAKYIILIADICIRLFQMILGPLIYSGLIIFIYSQFRKKEGDGNYDLKINKSVIPIILLIAIELPSLTMNSLIASLTHFNLNNIPKTLPDAFEPGSIGIILELLFCSVFGFAAARFKKEDSKPVLELCFVTFLIMHKILHSLSYLVPVFLFCLFAILF